MLVIELIITSRSMQRNYSCLIMMRLLWCGKIQFFYVSLATSSVSWQSAGLLSVRLQGSSLVDFRHLQCINYSCRLTASGLWCNWFFSQEYNKSKKQAREFKGPFAPLTIVNNLNIQQGDSVGGCMSSFKGSKPQAQWPLQIHTLQFYPLRLGFE